MNNVVTLQERLEERAKQKFLNKFIEARKAFAFLERSYMSDYRVIKRTGQDNESSKQEGELHWVFLHDIDFAKSLWELHKTHLIQAEVDAFLRNYEDLKMQVENLGQDEY